MTSTAKKVLITGSLGYIGSVLTNHLQLNGHICKGIDIGFFKDCKIYENDDSRTIFKSASDINASDLIDID